MPMTRGNGLTSHQGFVRGTPVPADLGNRAKLRQALTNLHDEQARLAQFERAREKSRADSWEIAARLTEATANLTKLREQEPARLARAAHGRQLEPPIRLNPA